MMNSKIKFLVFIFLTVLLNSCRTKNCPPPKKNNNISMEAVWKGGCDGGYWVMIKDTNESFVYDITIYLESGEIELRNRFIMQCQSKIIKANDLIKLIDSFDGVNIITTMKQESNQNYCILTLKN